jgi:hypothetical protein
MFSVAGDSMLFVDKHGQRVINEKLPYNELAQKFFEWDASAGEGRPQDQHRRPSARRHGPADSRPVRRGQLRRLGIAPRLLGWRRDDRPHVGVRLSRGAGSQPRAVKHTVKKGVHA